MGQLIIIVAMFALLWVLLIRPQRKRQLEQRELHESVEVGDEILTAGGLYGHVRELGEDDDLVVETDEEPVEDEPAVDVESTAVDDQRS